MGDGGPQHDRGSNGNPAHGAHRSPVRAPARGPGTRSRPRAVRPVTAEEADRPRVAYVELPDGTPVWARISQADELELPDGAPLYTDAGFAGRAGERVQAQVAGLGGLITGVARSVAQGLRAVRPDEVSVEFGIELTGKAGKVVGLLADGEAKAALTVTLTWQNGGPPELDEAPAEEDGAGPGAPEADGPPGRDRGAHPPAHRGGQGTGGAAPEPSRDGGGRHRREGRGGGGRTAPGTPHRGGHRTHPWTAARV